VNFKRIKWHIAQLCVVNYTYVIQKFIRIVVKARKNGWTNDARTHKVSQSGAIGNKVG